LLATPCQVSGVPSTVFFDEDGMPDLAADGMGADYVPPHPRTQNRKRLTLAARAKLKIEQKVDEKNEKSKAAALQQKQQSEMASKKREMSTPKKRDKPEAPDRPSATKARKAQPPPAGKFSKAVDSRRQPVLCDLELTRPIVCATSEASARCELCAFVIDKRFTKRVHVSTLTSTSYGSMYVEHTKALAQLIEQGGFTKAMILERRKVMALSR
jgi:hypothetical protein